MKKIFILVMLILPSLGFSQGTENYLILSDIGEYICRPKRVITIGNAGVLVPTGHFAGHGDMTYEGIYIHPQTYVGVEVQVTQHAGSDSDIWLLHEVEKSFRTYYGIPGDPLAMRMIDGNTVIVYGSAGWAYRWISGNKVIQISYHDSQMEKPEPLEVVSAYLAKHPSTLTPVTSADLRTDTSKTKWIKDEMERRLWLCDKWFYELQKETVEIDKVIRESYDHMKVFLDYREKYYGISAKEEKRTLWGYKQANNGTGIKNKLAEYKIWWKVNKDKPINL